MTVVTFPEITPTARRYTPGKQPETVFQSQNGSTVLVQFGGQFVNSELVLEFANISDDQALEILNHYASIKGDDSVKFKKANGLGGMEQNLINGIETGNELLRYRYKQPPVVTSVYPGISTVQCSFVGV